MTALTLQYAIRSEKIAQDRIETEIAFEQCRRYAEKIMAQYAQILREIQRIGGKT